MNPLFVATALTLTATGVSCFSNTHSELNGPRVEALVERCIEGTQGAEDAQRFIGMAEAEVWREAAAEGLTVRVLGKDDECLSRTDDLRRDRLNVLFVDGDVVWADLF